MRSHSLSGSNLAPPAYRATSSSGDARPPEPAAAAIASTVGAAVGRSSPSSRNLFRSSGPTRPRTRSSIGSRSTRVSFTAVPGNALPAARRRQCHRCVRRQRIPVRVENVLEAGRAGPVGAQVQDDFRKSRPPRAGAGRGRTAHRHRHRSGWLSHDVMPVDVLPLACRGGPKGRSRALRAAWSASRRPAAGDTFRRPPPPRGSARTVRFGRGRA